MRKPLTPEEQAERAEFKEMLGPSNVSSMLDLSEAIRGVAQERLEYLTDGARHLICRPYSVENLHRMARELNIKPCWFHSGSKFPHYDIPKRRIAEIEAKCTLITSAALLRIIKGA